VRDIYPSRLIFVEQNVFVRVEYSIAMNVQSSNPTSTLPTRFENTPIVIFAEQYAIIGIIAAVVKYIYAYPGVRMTSKNSLRISALKRVLFEK